MDRAMIAKPSSFKRLAALAGILMLLPGNEAMQVTFERVSGAPGAFINTHSISGDGTRLIFVSAGDHTGANPDHNLELFVYTAGQIYQLTQIASQPNYMDNGGAQTNYDGTRVVFRSRFALHSNGAQLPSRDLFLARITYGAGAPTVTFQRLTTTSENGAFVFSGNGGAVILATKSNLGGNNASGKLQLVKITLDPAVTFTRLTAEPTGIADPEWAVTVTTSYDGQQVAFHSDLDLDANNNPQGAQQIYRIMPNGGVGQLTDVPAGRRASDPAITDDGSIVFTSNADLVGQNADGNTEIFRIGNSGAGITQLTNSTAADNGFGGANDDIDISPDGSVIVFNSRADHLPAAGSSPGNADGNREIFLARYAVGSPVVFEQLTNTANPNPGTRFENVFPRTSNTGNKVGFNSDLDLGVPGTGYLYVATVPAPSPTTPPVITSFNPPGGGPGLPVTIRGDHLASATQVRFGALAAPGFQVLSNSRLVATAPSGVVDGAISVTTPHGTAIGGTFRAASFVTFGEEFNQGLPQYPGVAGKDALVRVFSGTSIGGWLVNDAQLQVRMPSGAVVAIPPSMFSPILTNTVQEFSERSNVNFYVPGAVLGEAGAYDFTASITTQGQVVHNRTFSATLVPTKDVVLVFQSLMRHPDLDEWRTILGALDQFSRIHPIRSGVGDLVGAIGADEPHAGFRVAYLNAPVFAAQDGLDQITCIAVSCWELMLRDLEERLAIVNSGGFEATEFSALFLPRDRLLRGNGQVLDCDDFVTFGAAGFGRMPGTASFTQLCVAVGSTFAHEVAHNMGLVAAGAANSNGSGHTATRDWQDRAFNIPDRFDVPGPTPTMFPFASIPDEHSFLENAVNGQPVDYTLLVDQRRLGGTTSSIEPRRAWGGGAEGWSLQEPRPRFVLAADVDARGGAARVRLAFTAPPGTTVSPVDSTSEYSLWFYAARRVLARERVPADPVRAVDARSGETAGDVLNVLRPLPVGTTSVELRRGDRVLARVRPGSSVPSVRLRPLELVQGPRGRMLSIEWRSSDPDRDSLVHFVEVSRDGRRWVPLSGAIHGNALRVPIEGLPGGAAVRVRVSATDGLNIGRAISTGIRLPAHAPVAAIVRPRRGRVPRFVQRDTIIVSGLAYDLEEGILQGGAAGTRFRWTVDGRPAGSGVTVRLGRLKIGRHRVVLTVSDAAGMRGADTLLLDVLRDTDGDGITDLDEARVPQLDPGNLFDGGLAPDVRLGTWRDRIRRRPGRP